MKLLHVDSSILGEASASRQLSAAIVRALTRAMPDLQVVRRDLDAEPIPHLDSRLLAAVRPDIAGDGATRDAAEKGTAALEEFLGADIVVIGAPMYISRSRASSRPGSTASSLVARRSATRRPAPKDLPAARR